MPAQTRRHLGCLWLGFAAACHPQPAGVISQPTPPESALGATAAELPERPFRELSPLAKKRCMNEHVLPAMETRFQAFDPRRYAGFSCATCHGPDMLQRQFAMPSPHLLALAPTGSEAQKAMVREQPEMVRFMFSQVLPEMQALLQASPFDPGTQTGFSCYACHPSTP